MYVDDELTLTMQLNAYSEAVRLEAWFELDSTRYIIVDIVRDGSTHGTITYKCKRQAGSYA